VSGRSSSVQVNIKSAPRGLGIAAAKVPKIILGLAGVKDVWMQSRGQTETTLNFALATFDALKETTKMALRESQKGIVAGKAGETSG
jgi:small subunit ribosomal protein S5